MIPLLMLHFSFHDASRWAVRSCVMSVLEGDTLYLVPVSAVMHDEHGDLHQRTRSPHVPLCSFSHNSLIPGVGVGLILLRQDAYRAGKPDRYDCAARSTTCASSEH